MAKRLYQIAFELGVPPRRFIQQLHQAGILVNNQMVVIPEAQEKRIHDVHAALKPVPVSASTAVAELPPLEEAPEPASETYEVREPVEEAEPEVEEAPVVGEAPRIEQPVAPEGSVATLASATAAPAPVAPGRDRPKRRPGEPQKPLELVPTMDPRAGRLIKAAPRGGVTGITPPARPGPRERGPVDLSRLNPALPAVQHAPGARRDSHRRGAPGQEVRDKHGKETFHLRKARGSEPRVRPDPAMTRPKSLEVTPPLSLKKFSELSGLKIGEIVRVLFTNHKMLVTTNSMLAKDALEILGLEFEIEITFAEAQTAETELLGRIKVVDDPKDQIARPPVVTILGHVDHGKTTLLDKIRTTDVASHESGGITQHIGASQVTLADGRKVTFIDTPGHEAFTEMRARGAQVTDVVVLVVAADDGPMPQTVEAISHARAANVPIVVALTKCDRREANPTKVKQALTEHGVFCEGFGGDVSAFEVSGVTGKGVPELLEHLALLVEVDAERFRANPNRPAEGVVIEAQNSPQRGIVATVIVRNGTLKKGDPIVAGDSWGSVRAMVDDRGHALDALPPGAPAEVIGLDRAPDAGSKFYGIPDRAQAEEIVILRRQKNRERELAAQTKPTTVESLLGAIDQGKVQGLNIVLKADVKGSLEPLKLILGRLGNEEVKVKVLHAAVGAVNESDVVLAAASSAWIVAFHVGSDDKARAKAKMVGVQIKPYKIIYDVENDVRDALEGKLAPEARETVMGHLEVLKVFASSRLGNIAGCRVKDGIVKRDATIRVTRDSKVLATGKLASLRREKDEAREVREGFECGLRIEGFDTWKEGDQLEAFSVELIARKLGP